MVIPIAKKIPKIMAYIAKVIRNILQNKPQANPQVGLTVTLLSSIFQHGLL